MLHRPLACICMHAIALGDLLYPSGISPLAGKLNAQSNGKTADGRNARDDEESAEKGGRAAGEEGLLAPRCDFGPSRPGSSDHQVLSMITYHLFFIT